MAKIVDMKGRPIDPQPVHQFVSLKDYNEAVEIINGWIERVKLLEKLTRNLEAENADLRHKVEKLSRTVKPWWRR